MVKVTIRCKNPDVENDVRGAEMIGVGYRRQGVDSPPQLLLALYNKEKVPLAGSPLYYDATEYEFLLEKG